MLLFACAHPSVTTIYEDDNISLSGNETDVTDAVSEDEAPAEDYIIFEGDDGIMRSDITSTELTSLMGNGINLGNTFEAYGRAFLGTDASVTAYETSWGQPVTTFESIRGMKASGFDTLRIPVAWTNTMDFENGDYSINEDYLARVREVADYAIENDMYVIINDHWDGGWWGMFGSADETTRQKALDIYISMWTQVAMAFRDYSDYVIFESANEELGYRLNDRDIAKDSGTLGEDECYETANMINQTFVNTVRGTGGNNASRFLLIAGYGTEIDRTIDNRYVMPADSADDRLLISVHYYEPTGYCLFDDISDWGTEEDIAYMNERLVLMQEYTDRGIGVVIGECGVLMEHTDNILKAGTQEYLNHFLDNCDKYGYCPVFWDCNNMYDREGCMIRDESIAEIFAERAAE